MTRNYVFFNASKPIIVARPPPANCDVISRVDPALADHLARSRPELNFSPQARAGAGHLLLQARDKNGTAMAWGWMTLALTGDIAVPFELGLWIAMPAGSAYLWDFFTRPDARGRKLYPALLVTGARYCWDHGIDTVICWCRAKNIASRRGLISAGFDDESPVSISRIGALYRVNGAFGHETIWKGRPLAMSHLLCHA